MKTQRHTFTQMLFSISVLALFAAAPAQAETINCTAITSLPTTISTQGNYCLTGHLATNLASGDAITITVNNVILDLNGYKIGNLAAGASTGARGIYAWQRKNITIKNGTIRGFSVGIYLDDVAPFTISQGHNVHHIRADMNTYVGMWIEGRGNVIKNNTVVDTGGTTNSNNAYGILAQGPGALIKDNTVYETVEQSTASAYGIFMYAGDGTVLWNNSVGNAAFGTGTSTGIYMTSSDDVLVRGNHITTMVNGLYFNSSTGKYMSNLTSGSTTAFTGGTAVGTNN